MGLLNRYNANAILAGLGRPDVMDGLPKNAWAPTITLPPLSNHLRNAFAPAPRPVRIEAFFSHKWGNDRRDEIHRLVSSEWLRGIDYADHSITSAHPVSVDGDRELLKLISRRIRACDVLVVSAGMEGTHSGWMDREIESAVQQDVPVIAVIPRNQSRRWTTAMEMADDVVGWRGDSIRNAILNHLPAWKRDAVARQVMDRQLAEALSPLLGSFR